MRAHQFGSMDNGSQCFVCGGYWDASREDDATSCPGRTDLEHGTVSETGHVMDCDAAADTGTCEHSAAAHGCNCDFCQFA